MNACLRDYYDKTKNDFKQAKFHKDFRLETAGRYEAQL